jgi:hypothetical protein
LWHSSKDLKEGIKMYGRRKAQKEGTIRVKVLRQEHALHTCSKWSRELYGWGRVKGIKVRRVRKGRPCRCGLLF